MYRDQAEVDMMSEHSLTITTFTEITNQTLTECGVAPKPLEKCARIWDNVNKTGPKQNFVGGIENFTLLFDHSITTPPDFGLTLPARNMSGTCTSSLRPIRLSHCNPG